jgi:hypothetical protein
MWILFRKYTFHSHGAAWFPLLRVDNIREWEVKECVLQFRIQHKMKQDLIPEGIKKPKPTPLRTRIPIAHAAAVLPVIDAGAY